MFKVFIGSVVVWTESKVVLHRSDMEVWRANLYFSCYGLFTKLPTVARDVQCGCASFVADLFETRIWLKATGSHGESCLFVRLAPGPSLRAQLCAAVLGALCEKEGGTVFNGQWWDQANHWNCSWQHWVLATSRKNPEPLGIRSEPYAGLHWWKLWTPVGNPFPVIQTGLPLCPLLGFGPGKILLDELVYQFVRKYSCFIHILYWSNWQDTRKPWYKFVWFNLNNECLFESQIQDCFGKSKTNPHRYGHGVSFNHPRKGIELPKCA